MATRPSSFFIEVNQLDLLGWVTTGNIWQFGVLRRESKQIEQGLNLYRVTEDIEAVMRILLAVLMPQASWNLNGTSNCIPTDSLGVGWRWLINHDLTLQLNYDIPLVMLDDESNFLQDDYLYFSVRYQPF